MSASTNLFNEDYYEHGVAKRLSGYENYRWMPQRSISEAVDIVNAVDFQTCCEFGCAKGFLVHALRLLGKSAFGVDISEYAVRNAMPQVAHYVKLIDKSILEHACGRGVDLVIAKDVLEHVPEEDIPRVLGEFRDAAKRALLVIPLGDNDLFRIREYEIDVTHVTKKDEEWWLKKIREAGWELQSFDYSLGRVKGKWVDSHPHGNGFFILT